MDREGILRLIRRLKASTATELEVRDGKARVRLVRPLTPAAAPLEAAAPVAAAAGAAPAVETHGVLVPSGHVGLFRQGREPGAAPLVTVGQKVRKGQALGVVESLRRPVVIESSVDGELLDILVEDGARVEYGTPLFRLLPSSSDQ
jgi:acetyl-CoA carboxylase biotin carboxyl carrier protein